MTKHEFMQRLNTALNNLPYEDKTDIINDYEEHFRVGRENGKTEDEISESLGKPEDLAVDFYGGEQVNTNFNNVSANVVNENIKVPNERKNSIDKTMSVIAVVAFIIFVIIPLFGTLFSLWASLLSTMIAFLVSSIAIFISLFFIIENTLLFVGFVFLTIAFLTGGILLVFASWFSMKGIVGLLKQFIKICKSIIGEWR